MTDLTIDGKTFRVEVKGGADLPALMLSHSLGVDLSMWDAQMPALTKQFRVIRYDTRGHGGSAPSDTPISIADLGADALSILDALEIDRVYWLGLSMGGAIGLWLLVNAPERIDRAVLANTAAKFGTPESWNARISSVLSDGLEENARATIERWFSLAFRKRQPDRVAAIQSLLRSVSAPGYAACCAALRDTDLREALRGINRDVLVITGRDDPVIPSEDSTALITAIKGAKHAALDARHMSNIEAEAAFNAAIVTFLTTKSSRGRAPRKKPPTRAASESRRGAGRRSNTARNPLKKAQAKDAAKKKRSSATAKTTKPVAGRRTAAKTSATRRGTVKTPVKKRPAKAKPPKAIRSRRPTPVSSARAPIKKVKPRAATAKVATKKPAKKPAAKKLAATRRRPPKKTGRPTGRRRT